MTCLMLVDEKNRKFFTSRKNRLLLDEFTTKFNIKTYNVKTKKENIKTVDELIIFYCDQSYNGNHVEYTMIDAPSKCLKTRSKKSTQTISINGTQKIKKNK